MCACVRMCVRVSVAAALDTTQGPVLPQPLNLGEPREGGGVLGWGTGRRRLAQLTVPSLLCPSGERGLPGFSASGKC